VQVSVCCADLLQHSRSCLRMLHWMQRQLRWHHRHSQYNSSARVQTAEFIIEPGCTVALATMLKWRSCDPAQQGTISCELQAILQINPVQWCRNLISTSHTSQRPSRHDVSVYRLFTRKNERYRQLRACADGAYLLGTRHSWQKYAFLIMLSSC
jgi:hypothetical protein